MILDKIANWISEIETTYPMITVKRWETPDHFLEDDLGYYVGLFPLKASENGYIFLSMASDKPGATISGRGRYYVVWRLPGISDEIIRATIIESAKLGQVKSVTWNIELMYKLFTDSIQPKKDLPFVAVEVEITGMITNNRDLCSCLLACYTGS